MKKAKKEIEKIVSDSVKPLINALGRYDDGPAPMEEYGTLYWTKSSVQKICQAVFDKTYEVMSDENIMF